MIFPDHKLSFTFNQKLVHHATLGIWTSSSSFLRTTDNIGADSFSRNEKVSTSLDYATIIQAQRDHEKLYSLLYLPASWRKQTVQVWTSNILQYFHTSCDYRFSQLLATIDSIHCKTTTNLICSNNLANWQARLISVQNHTTLRPTDLWSIYINSLKLLSDETWMCTERAYYLRFFLALVQRDARIWSHCRWRYLQATFLVNCLRRPYEDPVSFITTLIVPAPQASIRHQKLENYWKFGAFEYHRRSLHMYYSQLGTVVEP